MKIAKKFSVEALEEELYYRPVPPACACGCGEPVRWRNHGASWSKYVNECHYRWHLQTDEELKAAKSKKSSEVAVRYHQSRRANDRSVPIAEFRQGLKQIKAERGWTNRQMAGYMGIAQGTFNTLMYDNRLKSVSQVTARAYFRRMAGLGAPVANSNVTKKRLLSKVSKQKALATRAYQELEEYDDPFEA